ncbi:PREDICTED: uncharacterized protein LOC101299292 isoform X1 [Fragaria vesca subsp. vesca]|uniref:uncharacterized protein LOC101299292 isoform X1 n=2 Tax=Fragaria vesca subsp. vesca TaxID=101020 RepID=UPI0002C2F878|nr:PREDICTED: uncharacterized protein LOC101299292 isoform X1 [Fragaria vesca subsp. vesca]XP_011462813.1 PREDICTED: uncharacterized protein LOC101299292 isoform X1 [Fragaria vesca subsp. vesca]
MEDPPPSSSPSDLTTLHRQVLELEALLDRIRRDDDSDSPASDSQGLLKDCFRFLESRVEKIVSDCSDVGLLGDQDFEAYVGRFEEELSSVEAESAKVSDEIEGLVRTHEEDLNRLNVDIGQVKCSLEFVGLQDLDKEKLVADVDIYGKYQLDPMDVNEEKFKLLELENQIDMNHIILKSLQDLEHKLKWLDATEQFEDAFSGIKVISFEESCIRLSLSTYVPKSKGLSQQIIEDTTSVNHELLIELVEGTMDLSDAEIFPNDVCIRDILDAAKSLSKSSLQWFVTKVQDKIVKQHGANSGK